MDRAIQAKIVIVHVSKTGESAGVYQEIVLVWKDGKRQELLRKYEP